ncbi:MAG: NeuD/PglB/VioB family sugar acetyltransferase [Chloroflexi bacterium]|nr:NeuD/PglB/VioB family sugar acetyltransferase [Chloroflexota bacterium]
MDNMDDLFPVLVPLVNPNESDSLLARIFVKEGQKVKIGEGIAIFETTKSTLELVAERDGFVLGIAAREGEILKAGELLCFLGEQPDLKIPRSPLPRSEKIKLNEPGVPPGLRMTQPALRIAREKGVDLDSFPKGTLVTEKMVQAMVLNFSGKEDSNLLIIYGGGGHAKSLVDLIRAEGKFKIAGILDDALLIGSSVLEIPVLGGGDLLAELRKKGIATAINAVGGIGNISPRLKVYEKLKAAGFSCPTVIHPRAFLEPTASVRDGGQIFFNAYIGSDVRVGYGCIVNTLAILSHDCELEDFVNISPGAVLAGGVKVKERALIGMGVTINLNVTIGAGARIGNSAVVKADVPENGIVRAGSVWPVE